MIGMLHELKPIKEGCEMDALTRCNELGESATSNKLIKSIAQTFNSKSRLQETYRDLHLVYTFLFPEITINVEKCVTLWWLYHLLRMKKLTSFVFNQFKRWPQQSGRVGVSLLICGQVMSIFLFDSLNFPV